MICPATRNGKGKLRIVAVVSRMDNFLEWLVAPSATPYPLLEPHMYAFIGGTPADVSRHFLGPAQRITGSERE